jgi:hypothetical protein
VGIICNVVQGARHPSTILVVDLGQNYAHRFFHAIAKWELVASYSMISVVDLGQHRLNGAGKKAKLSLVRSLFLDKSHRNVWTKATEKHVSLRESKYSIKQ